MDNETIQLLQEAKKRGILSKETEALFDEALQRGIVKKTDWNETAGQWYRPALEAGLSAVGGIVGSATGPVGTVAGGTLGYAAGDKIADIIDQSIGTRKPRTLPEEMRDTGQAMEEGAMWEMGGAAAGKALQGVIKGGKWVFQKAKDVFPVQKAAQQFVASTSYGDIYARNAAEADEIENAIHGLKFSADQKTNDPELIKLARSLARGADDDAARMLLEAQASNDDAIRNYYQQHFPDQEGIDDVLSAIQQQKKAVESGLESAHGRAAAEMQGVPVKDPQHAGADISGAVDEATAPVKKAMNELESQIPDYRMKFDNLRGKIDEALKDKKLSATQRKAVSRFSSMLDEITDTSGESTHTAFGVRRTLNDEITKYRNQGNESAAAALMQVKNGIEADLAEVSRLARSGKVGTYNGQPINLDDIASKYEWTTQRIAKLKGEQAPDIDTMYKELTEAGYPYANQVFGESKKSYLERLSKDYERVVGKPVPVAAKAGAAENIEALQKNADAFQEILKGAETGQDVGSMMKAYNEYASKEWFGRFDTPAIRQVKSARKAENIPRVFWNQSGADDLIKAIGKDKASNLMREYAGYDMLQNVTDPATGQIVSKKLKNWLWRNKSVLKKYGLDFKNLEEAQAAVDKAHETAREFEKSIAAKMLGADPEKAIAKAFAGQSKTTARAAKELLDQVGKDKIARKGLQKAFADHIMTEVETTAKNIDGSNVVSPAKLHRIMKQYEPAMKVIYADSPEKIWALKNIQKAYEIASRNKTSPLGGGSDTAENIMTAMRRFMPGKIAKITGPVAEVFKGYSDRQVNRYLARALLDPDYADTLAKLYRTKNVKLMVPAIDGQMIDLDRLMSLQKGQAVASMGLAAQSSSTDQEPVK